LSKIGRIAMHWSRPVEGTSKTVTISKEADGWYACCSYAQVPAQPLPPTGKETGIDIGLRVFLVTAGGEVVENPRHHHKTARALVRTYDTIYLEDLQVCNLSCRPAPKLDGAGGYLQNGATQKAGLNKSIQDAGWSSFLHILAYKAACAGKRAEAVPPAYTTQDCSRCGKRVCKSLSVCTHVCPSCGLILDREENAVRNILWAGQALRGLVGSPAGMNREPAGL
jgi:putative transposase